MIAKKNPNGSLYYIHTDHLGSTSVVTDSLGNVVEYTVYDPWGEVETGGTASKFLYTRQEKDSETGLNYYNFRYYNSDIKKFIQPDDIIPNIYNPQTLNRFSYALNNPLRYTDPSGHDFVTTIALAGASLAALPEEVIFGAAVVTGIAVSAVIFPNQTRTIINTIGSILTGTSTITTASKPTTVSKSPAPPITKSTTNNTPTTNRSSDIPTGGTPKSPMNNIDKILPLLPLSQTDPNKLNSGVATANEVLESAVNWLGHGYRQIGEIVDGVFRSADDLRQFRMSPDCLTDDLCHVHFQSIGEDGRQILETGHVYLIDMINPNIIGR